MSGTIDFPAFGLAFARDEGLPKVDVLQDGRVKAVDPKAKKAKGAAKPQATVDLAKALTIVRVDPNSPFAK